MATNEIVEVMAELVPDDGQALARSQGSQALAKAQAIQTELVPYLAGNPAYGPLWQQFQGDPATMSPALAGVLQVILAADAALARRLDILLAEYRKAASAPRTSTTVGGSQVSGDVKISDGVFVGRDQIVHGDQAGGNLSKTGDISGSVGVAVGSDIDLSVSQGLKGGDLAALFAAVYQRIEDRPKDPDVDKEELTETVQKIEDEAAKGEDANPNKVNRWLKNLTTMAPDIFEVTLACLTNPAAGIAAVIRNVAEKAKEGSEAQDS